jgi:hypothetical protein
VADANHVLLGISLNYGDPDILFDVIGRRSYTSYTNHTNQPFNTESALE